MRPPKIQYHSSPLKRLDSILNKGVQLPRHDQDVTTFQHSSIPTISTADEFKYAEAYNPSGVVFELAVDPSSKWTRRTIRNMRKGENLADAVDRWVRGASEKGYDAIYVDGMQSTVGNQILNPNILTVKDYTILSRTVNMIKYKGHFYRRASSKLSCLPTDCGMVGSAQSVIKPFHSRGIASTQQYSSDQIFLSASKHLPENWCYDHVGFIDKQTGQFIQMSGHRHGEGVFSMTRLTEDKTIRTDDYDIVNLPRTVTFSEDPLGAQNCVTFVVAVLEANGIHDWDVEDFHDIFKCDKKARILSYRPVGSQQTSSRNAAILKTSRKITMYHGTVLEINDWRKT